MAKEFLEITKTEEREKNFVLRSTRKNGRFVGYPQENKNRLEKSASEQISG